MGAEFLRGRTNVQRGETRETLYLQGFSSALLFGQRAAGDAQDGDGVDPHADNFTAGGCFAQAHQLLGGHTLTERKKKAKAQIQSGPK